jgi:hypothetical protein
MTKQTYPWIVMGDGTNPKVPFGFKCLRCGAIERLPESVRFDVVFVWAKSFEGQHKHCTLQEVTR